MPTKNDTITERTRELNVPAEESQLSGVRDFIANVCEEAGFAPRDTNNTKLAVDEACTNIIKHAYRGNGGVIRIRTCVSDGALEISILDSGKTFDFAGVKDPDLEQYVETGRKGGFGVFLINRLMDAVEYRSRSEGNELVLTKRSRTAVPKPFLGQVSWRGSIRYKFTIRASLGLFVIIAAIWGYIFMKQSSALNGQRAAHWMEMRRLAESLSNKSKELLLSPEAYSIEQTTLTAFVNRMLEGNDDLAYARVVDSQSTIMSSGDINEMFSSFDGPKGQVILEDGRGVRWTRVQYKGEAICDISVPVQVKRADNGVILTVGFVHLGVREEGTAGSIRDPRPLTTVIIIALYLIGVGLIVLLVSVFVKPIQALTDGVRAIRQGTLDGKIDVSGPAEIGAIATVFNEITEKFKKAQESVLEQEKLQKEIEVAKQIQQALLPRQRPDVSGYDIAPYYQAAKEVGGDYYDFVQVDEDTIGVVVADVSGKGVPGSLVMTMIRTALRMEARGNKNASDVMTKMNDFVTDDMRKGMFVTMFYVILDSKNRIISYASAGHNPMILYRAATRDIFFLNPRGFPVGISLPDEELFRKSISLEKIKLKKDDMLVIYTDGVTEAMNARREQYGEDRMIDLVKQNGDLHPSDFIKVLEKDIKKFTGGNPQNDDITVVAIKEKLAADDVLFGIRKKLIDMVDVGGMSVKEACAAMKVSPGTYYRYKKRMAVMGERGLHNKVLREDMDLKRVTIEERKSLLAIIRNHPGLGAKRIAEEYNTLHGDDLRELTERMVYDELKRLNLNTRDLRVDYLKRNGLWREEDRQVKSNREMVEELIEDIGDITKDSHEEPTPRAGSEARQTPTDDAVEESSSKTEHDGSSKFTSYETRTDLSELEEGMALLRIHGHIDSVSWATLEKQLGRAVRSASKIIVDLSDVTYISSGGWGIFIGDVKRLRERSGDVVLVGMSPEVHDVYDLLGFGEILHAFEDTESAIDYFHGRTDGRTAKPEGILPGEDDESPDTPATPPPPREWESLSIEATTVGDEGDIAVLLLQGVIDTISAEKLREAIDRVMASGIHKIIVDMSLVEYVSSGGWGTFTERLRELRRTRGDLKLFGMDPDVHYVFTMLGFNLVLSSFDILSEAIDEFRNDPSGDGSQLVAQQEAEGAEGEGVWDLLMQADDDVASDTGKSVGNEEQTPTESGEGYDIDFDFDK